MNFDHLGRIGFVYHLELYRPDGSLEWTERWENILPNESRDYILNAALNAGSQLSSWYCGIYSGSYEPLVADTMATFPASATEITTAYSEATRPALVDGSLVSGLWANTASPAEFTFAADTTVRGGFISSSPTKGGTAGVLLSAVLGASPKSVYTGEVLRVVTGLSLATA